MGAVFLSSKLIKYKKRLNTFVPKGIKEIVTQLQSSQYIFSQQTRSISGHTEATKTCDTALGQEFCQLSKPR